MHNNPVIKSAYWRGVAAALDSIFLSEFDHAKRIGLVETEDDVRDAILIVKTMRNAVRACRRDMKDVGSGSGWTAEQEQKCEAELTYQLNMDQHPEELPHMRSPHKRKYGDEQDGAGPDHRPADAGRDSEDSDDDEED